MRLLLWLLLAFAWLFVLFKHGIWIGTYVR